MSLQLFKSFLYHSFRLPYFNLPLMGTFTWLTPPGLYRVMTCRERELAVDHIHIFLTTQGHGGPSRMSEQLSAGAISETTRTLKTIISFTHRSALILTRRICEGWLWWPNDIRGPRGPKASWHLSYRWGKTPKNLPQETCPDWGRTRACSTAADNFFFLNNFLNIFLDKYCSTFL